MGLIFVPYIPETLRKNSQRVTSESTSEERSLSHGRSSNRTSYQSLEDLVRMYDNPDRPDTEIMADSSGSHDPEGEPQPSNSNSPATEQSARVVPGDQNFFLPLRRPLTATPGSTAVSTLDERTLRLLELLSAYYVRSAYDQRRTSNPTPPPPTASTSSGATSSPSSPSASSPTGLAIWQSLRSSSDIVSRSTTTVPERFAESFARVYDAMPNRSSQTEGSELSSIRPQFILRPDPSEMSPEELRLSNWHNGPLTFFSTRNDDPDSNVGRPRLINLGPGLLRAPNQRSEEELVPFVRGRTDPSSSASSSASTENPLNSSGGLIRYNSNTDHDSESGESNPQAFLWHNETRTNVTTHGCLRVIMRRHQGWEEQAAQNGFVEYWHYTTVPSREAPGFQVIRDGVARLPWPMLALAGLQRLRSFAYQINSVHHRDTPLTDYQGNIFDVILVPSMTTPAPLDN